MLGTLILGILAGLGAPYAEPHVKRALENLLLADPPVSPAELRLFSFALCLAAAAALAWLFGDDGALVLAVGAAVGVFAPRAVERYQAGRRGGD